MSGPAPATTGSLRLTIGEADTSRVAEGAQGGTQTAPRRGTGHAGAAGAVQRPGSVRDLRQSALPGRRSEDLAHGQGTARTRLCGVETPAIGRRVHGGTASRRPGKYRRCDSGPCFILRRAWRSGPIGLYRRMVRSSRSALSARNLVRARAEQERLPDPPGGWSRTRGRPPDCAALGWRPHRHPALSGKKTIPSQGSCKRLLTARGKSR